MEKKLNAYIEFLSSKAPFYVLPVAYIYLYILTKLGSSGVSEKKVRLIRLNIFDMRHKLYTKPEFRGERCRTCLPLHSHPHKKVMIISGRRNKCGNFIESTWIFSLLHKNICKLSQIRKSTCQRMRCFQCRKSNYFE